MQCSVRPAKDCKVATYFAANLEGKLATIQKEILLLAVADPV